MEDFLLRVFDNLIDRVSGPMKFRLVLQPLMAIIFAIRNGLEDAKKGRPPFAWALFTDSVHRRDLLWDSWKSVGKIFVVAIIIDIIYQYIVFRWFYPFEALVVATILSFVPYALIRGPVSRLVRWKVKRENHE